jgi:transcriptional regulator NrdR family protein
MDPIKVVKRDGAREPFDPEKIANVLKTAGLNPEDSQKVAAKVADWVNSQKLPEISSLQIRDQISEILTSVNKQVADFFNWYQKTKQ